ncbi:MFS transporter [Alterisphingorhabdus coralli]|uniref:MFS transporter n=1 Tax=Alterisphingorhabdus coralli TaxID=3071408 RepID=A0AA97I171_9SPHN|nr:MFS transporter [Parasphingorhabdus sp. SCSIO 66989]WOE74450.1 MFS transporter [Parasphingorhabdus sp. SCSIO 66989]
MTAAPFSEKVPLKTKLAFGTGAIAFGIKDNGFSVFLLIFYNQVVGLPANLVGLVIGLALLIDAFIDPLVGNLSDRTRTKWGRRHPWIYGSAVPIALAWLLIWNPPEMGTGATLGYLLAAGVMVRASLSAYEVPSISLMPEMTSDYDERTMVVRYRALLGWAGGLFMLAMAYGVILVPSAEYPDGTLNPAGYPRYAFIGAIIMFVAVMISGIGTHRDYARPPKNEAATAESLKEILSTLGYTPFLILMIAALFGYAGQGLTFALTNYLFEYIWEFGQTELVIYSGVLFTSAIIAFIVIAPVAKRASKPRAAAVMALISGIFGTAPYWLRYLDLAPENGSPMVLPFLFTFIGIGIVGFISTMTLTVSMVADVTDHARRHNGKQTEGLFYAGYFFVQKAVTGLGIFFAGQLLGLVGFPEDAQPGSVAPDLLDNLAITYASLSALLSLGAMISFWKFPLGRDDHAEIIEPRPPLAALDNDSNSALDSSPAKAP